jgi:hypothetical protein
MVDEVSEEARENSSDRRKEKEPLPKSPRPADRGTRANDAESIKSSSSHKPQIFRWGRTKTSLQYAPSISHPQSPDVFASISSKGETNDVPESDVIAELPEDRGSERYELSATQRDLNPIARKPLPSMDVAFRASTATDVAHLPIPYPSQDVHGRSTAAQRQDNIAASSVASQQYNSYRYSSPEAFGSTW